MTSSSASAQADRMRLRRRRLRASSLSVVALAAAVVLVTQGAFVAHADDLVTAPADGVAAQTAEPADEIVEAPTEAEVPVAEAAEAPVEDPTEATEATEATKAPAEATEAPSDSPVETPAHSADETPAEPAEGIVETAAPAGKASDAVEAPLPAELVGENLPVVTNDDYYVIGSGETLTIAAPGILSNDSDPDHDAITVQQDSFTTWAGNTGAIVFGGAFTFTAMPGYSGTEKITYYAQDAVNNATPGTIYVTVVSGTPPTPNENQWPHPVLDTYTTPQDQPLLMPSHLGLLANDTDPEGDLITTQAVGPISTALGGTIQIDADGSFYYTPPAGVIGVDYIGYTAFDIFGGGSSSGVLISITKPGTTPAGPNQAPIAGPDQYTTQSGVPLVVDAAHGALVNDSDPEGTALIASNVSSQMSQAGGTGTVAADGSFVFVPAPGVVGDDYFTYTVTDEAGLPAQGSISITITPFIPVVTVPGDPTPPGTPADPGTPAEPGTPADPGTPAPGLPSSVVVSDPTVVTASENSEPTQNDDDALALTGFGAGPMLAASLGVIVLGALAFGAAGVVVAARRRRAGEKH